MADGASQQQPPPQGPQQQIPPQQLQQLQQTLGNENPIIDIETIALSAMKESLSTINAIAGRILNFFLSGVVKSIESVLPEFGESKSDSEISEANAVLMTKIRAIFSDPKLIEEMRLLATEVGKFLEVPMNELNEILKKEGEQMIDELTKLLHKLIVKMGITTKDAVFDTAGLVPPIDAILGIFTVASAMISITSTTTGKMLSIFAPAFVQILGTIAQEIKRGQTLYGQLGKFQEALMGAVDRAGMKTPELSIPSMPSLQSGITSVGNSVRQSLSTLPSVPTIPPTLSPSVLTDKVTESLRAASPTIPSLSTSTAPAPAPAPAPAAALRGGDSKLVLSTKRRTNPTRRRSKKHSTKHKISRKHRRSGGR